MERIQKVQSLTIAAEANIKDYVFIGLGLPGVSLLEGIWFLCVFEVLLFSINWIGLDCEVFTKGIWKM